MKTILITGGAGFIGSNFVHYYRSNHPDTKIINLDLLTYAGNLANLQSIKADGKYVFVKGDIGDKTLVSNLFKNENIDCIVNFAAESHVDRSIVGPEIFIKTNILGTFNLLENAKEAWQNNFKDKRFVHVSTDEVYGSLGPENKFTEQSPYAPNSPYSASKASSDHFVRAFYHTYGLPVITTNCSNNYGPFQFPEKLIPLIINNILEQRPLPVYGDGKNVRDWLYVEDHCMALDSVLEKGIIGRTYNIGGCNECTNINIVNEICRIMDNKLNLSPEKSSRHLITFVKDRPGHDRRYAIDASRITKELGWKPRETFKTGIRRTIDWYLENREWVRNVISGDYREYYKAMYGNR
ncbi:MAG: dTDP-glucose 4,6-dehydratase [bacterium]